MAKVHGFRVVPSMPPRLAPLDELKSNIWSLWNSDTVSLFHDLDPELWERTNHNPVALLNQISQSKLDEKARQEGFITHLNLAVAKLQYYLQQPAQQQTWFQDTWSKAHASAGHMLIAYFSAEFGLHEALPIYSGGLGVLAGDHLKSASDLGLPLVAVGLLYREGYFHQRLNAEGWQEERNPALDFFSLPLTRVQGPDGQPLAVTVEYPQGPVRVGIWKVQVGRVELYLLDTDLPENRAEDRAITARLYGGDQNARLRQEILLGIGGVRALRALNKNPTVCHMNEGHSSLLALERCRWLMEQTHISFAEAREAVAAGNVFTTHTPVPAGNDAFPRELMEKHLGNYYPQLQLSLDEFLALGRVHPADPQEPFGMTVLALRMAWHCNGVSQLHGREARKMWRQIWPGMSLQEIPIAAITNGVHTPSWLDKDFVRLYEETLHMRWPEQPTDRGFWQHTEKISDAELWRVHQRGKERLIQFVRQRLGLQLAHCSTVGHGRRRPPEVLDPQVLTLGFARRFATYKRATLLLRDSERLLRLLNDPQRPLQLLFAGKAHPRDDGGKHFIQEIVRFCRRHDVRNRLVFLEDYDINVARHMVQGVDVWLNTPRRPMEASGTSGMKAAINGVLNLSVLDGWWEEACLAGGADMGWAVDGDAPQAKEEYQDEIDSRELFDLLENQIVPLYYQRDAAGLPREWLQWMKASIRSICPKFNTNRMVEDYLATAYQPAHDGFAALVSQNAAAASALAKWKQHLRQHWPQVRVRDVKYNAADIEAGKTLHVEAVVELGAIASEHVDVQLYFGQLNTSDDFPPGTAVPMNHVAALADGAHQYVGEIPAATCGAQGFFVRVLGHYRGLVLKECPDDVLRPEPGLIHWG